MRLASLQPELAMYWLKAVTQRKSEVNKWSKVGAKSNTPCQTTEKLLTVYRQSNFDAAIESVHQFNGI